MTPQLTDFQCTFDLRHFSVSGGQKCQRSKKKAARKRDSRNFIYKTSVNRTTGSNVEMILNIYLIISSVSLCLCEQNTATGIEQQEKRK